MENNDKYVKYISLIALLIAVFSVSFGFAAFTRAINISAISDVSPKTTEYNGGVLSISNSSVKTGSVTASTTNKATAEKAILTKDTISNISAHFTKPGQSVKYSFYGYNDNTIVTYLNSVVFGTKTCKAVDGENTTLVNDACSSIKMTIKIGNETFTSNNVNVKNHSLEAMKSEPIEVKIEYLSSGAIADKKFKVDFGTSVLTYSTID